MNFVISRNVSDEKSHKFCAVKISPCGRNDRISNYSKLSMMLSGVMMLRHIGEVKAADIMEKAIAEIVREGRSLTHDMKGEEVGEASGTSRVADVIIEKMDLLKKKGAA